MIATIAKATNIHCPVTALEMADIVDAEFGGDVQAGIRATLQRLEAKASGYKFVVSVGMVESGTSKTCFGAVWDAERDGRWTREVRLGATGAAREHTPRAEAETADSSVAAGPVHGEAVGAVAMVTIYWIHV